MTVHSMTWMKDTRWQWAIIGSGIVGLAIVPWFVPLADIQAHNVLHHLNFIPLMVAGMLFGWRGAGFATFCALAVHSPHLHRSWANNAVDASDQIVELSIFGAAGIIAGFLSDRERAHRAKLERTTRELERVYQELQQNIERLRKSERLYAAGQLSASLAHEIRNPLASISGAAGILKRGHGSTKNVNDCFEIIEKESQRLNKLLTSFLDFARPRVPRFQRTDLNTILDSVVALARHADGFRDVELRRDGRNNLPEIECDPEQLKQVLLNLLINAAQASPLQGTVWLSASRVSDRVGIAIRDEGCGMPRELQDQMFDPFFTTKENGTGLGLAIASMIVDQHGGLLTAENNPGKGMTLRLELPLNRERPL